MDCLVYRPHVKYSNNTNLLCAGPYIKGTYSGNEKGVASVYLDWKLATGKAAIAYTGEKNLVSLQETKAGQRVGIVNSITKRSSVLCSKG